MNITVIIMFLIAISLYTFAYFRGTDLPAQGLKISFITFAQVLPLLIASFAIAGLVQVLIPRELIAKWLGAEAGLRGIWLGSLAGAMFTPGGPYVNFPIVASLYKSGASIGTLVAFITSWSLLALSRLPLEVSIIGFRFVSIRLASTFIFPPIAGLIAQTLFRK